MPNVCLCVCLYVYVDVMQVNEGNWRNAKLVCVLGKCVDVYFC